MALQTESHRDPFNFLLRYDMANKKPLWDPNFAPSYTPMEMLDLGIFEGIYTASIPGIPKKYKEHKNVLPKGSEPDVSINYYGVKSRQSLKEWKRNGWTTENSPLGWWMWYLLYFLGRRLGKEDEWQIGRWRSYVARHSAQVMQNCNRGTKSCRPKQRQGLLQWAWDSDTAFNQRQMNKNLNRLKRMREVSLEGSPIWLDW